MWLAGYPAGCLQLGVEHEQRLEEEQEEAAQQQQQAGGGCHEGEPVAGEQEVVEEVRAEFRHQGVDCCHRQRKCGGSEVEALQPELL